MHGNFVLAEDLPQETPPPQDSTLQPEDSESRTITWPLLSGESVQSLSALFYPKNKRMQRLFVQRTLQLSQEIRPHLNAYTTTNQASLIVIPNIKYLAKRSGKIRHVTAKKIHHEKPTTQPTLHMSYGLKDADKFALTPEMQTKYENLVKRNEKLKQDLEKLNAKLAHLQEVMAELNEKARRMQNAPAQTVASNTVIPPELPKPADEAKKPSASESVAAAPVAVPPQKPKPKIIKQVITPAEAATGENNSVPESFISQYWMQMISALFALAAIFAASLYRRKHAKSFSYYTEDKLQPMDANEFVSVVQDDEPPSTVDFSLSSSEFTSSITDKTLDAIMSVNAKEEGELVLEQANIYVNINRENDAINILKAQIQTSPKTSLHHWLALLDIYRKLNQKEEFLESAKQLHQVFNVLSPTWDNSAPPMVVPTSLLEFPHIIEHLIKLWADCDNSVEKLVETKIYLDTLLTDNRESERGGFGMDVLLEIKLLRDILDIRDRFSTKQ